MTLLFFLKPIFHQGYSPPSDDEPDRLPKKKKRKVKKPTKAFVEELTKTLELKEVDVRGYVEDILKRESEVMRLKEEAKAAHEEEERIRVEKEADERVKDLIESIGLMVKRSIAAKRKRLNTLIASILDWL